MTDVKVRWWWTQLGEAEIAAVARSIRESHINNGPVCREMERRLADQLGMPHAVLTTSGSMALLMSLLACDVKPGDEVITPAFGFIAGAHAIQLCGATVRLVDVLPDRPAIDPAEVAAAISPRTRAILIVHPNGRGRPCDMAALQALAAEHRLALIEDCAQALCSRNGDFRLGTRSDAAAFSLGITKLITTGEGGFVATRLPDTCHRLLKLRNHGTLAIADNRFDEFGFNFRFTDIQASIGLAQLDALPRKIAALRRVYEFYRSRLAGLHYLRLLPVDVDRGELPIWVEVLCADRDRVARLLADRGIQPRPFHPCLADSRHLAARCPGHFPWSRFYAAHGMILPSGPDQPAEHLEATVAALNEIAAEIQVSIDTATQRWRQAAPPEAPALSSRSQGP